MILQIRKLLSKEIQALIKVKVRGKLEDNINKRAFQVSNRKVKRSSFQTKKVAILLFQRTKLPSAHLLSTKMYRARIKQCNKLINRLMKAYQPVSSINCEIRWNKSFKTHMSSIMWSEKTKIKKISRSTKKIIKSMNMR